MIVFLVAQVIKEYSERKIRIKELQVEAEHKEARLAEHREQVQQIKEKWLPLLNSLLESINKNFSHFFKSLKCAGEVDLNIPENPVCDCRIMCMMTSCMENFP